MTEVRKPFAIQDLVRRSESGPCFVCAYLQGQAGYEHRLVAQTKDAVAFLDRYPTIFGRVIVSPKRHLEQVTGDVNRDQYLALQSFVYEVSEAVREVLAPERVYLLSLGSQAANAHVHWHVVPLPPGVPLAQQQFHSLMHEHGAVDPDAQQLDDYVAALQGVFARSDRIV